MIQLIAPLLFFTFTVGQAIPGKEVNMSASQLADPWKKLEDSLFSITYPPDWELNTSGQMGTSFMLFSPMESGQDRFRENINLIIQDLGKEKMNLDQYTAFSESQLSQAITNYKLVAKKKIRQGADEYQQILFTGEQGNYHLAFEQHYRVVRGKAYVLTFTAEQDKFETFKQTGGQILASFVLK